MKNLLLIIIAITLFSCTSKKSPEEKRKDLRDSVLNLTYEGKPSDELNTMLDTLLKPEEIAIMQANLLKAAFGDNDSLVIGKTYKQLIK